MSVSLSQANIISEPTGAKAVCIVCDVEITPENNSKEHIIQSALGGIRKASGVLCKACNSTTGLTWDAEAARQFQFLTLHLGISRERERRRTSRRVLHDLWP
jgi:hypothetical protein